MCWAGCRSAIRSCVDSCLSGGSHVRSSNWHPSLGAGCCCRIFIAGVESDDTSALVSEVAGYRSFWDAGTTNELQKSERVVDPKGR